jgi:uncharacterized protein (DUF305 family)
MNMRKYLMGIGAAAIVAVAAGCGGADHAAAPDAGHGESTSARPAAGHNEQDMAFAQAMIPHHQQAVDMAALAAERATDPKVKDLATRIKGAQDPEIEQMTTMLDEWGAAMEGMPSMDHGAGGAHGGMSGPGMMTEQQLAKLEKASGAAFDTLWVDMMIEHHQGAVDMANDELAKGGDADAKALARRILDAQQAEIEEMRAMA